jgi:hypothetical protein
MSTLFNVCGTSIEEYEILSICSKKLGSFQYANESISNEKKICILAYEMLYQLLL